MIILCEQHGYKNPLPISNGTIEPYLDILANEQEFKSFNSSFKKDSSLFTVKKNNLDTNSRSFLFEASYYVGVDWLVDDKVPIYIRPKLDSEKYEIDYLKLLFDSLKEPENFNHLENLYTIDFDKSSIEIKQNQDLLTPLLITQFIQILKIIVQKGLKKSYYKVTENLNARIKGKILINKTIKKNHFNNKKLYNYCEYSEFGINNIENQLLKKVLVFSKSIILNLKGVETSSLIQKLSFISPAFDLVSDIEVIDCIKMINSNSLYKEYAQALKLANLILKKYGFNISTTNTSKIKTPPFWIDMSMLFELYVYSKLRERFPNKGEVIYHKTFNNLEPDFILNSNCGNFKMVIDAKYKPRYESNNISTEDIRQISGYARIKSIYNYLNIDKTNEKNDVIDCLVIYSNQNCDNIDFKNINFIFDEDKIYVQFYKIGIKLPTQ